MSLSTVFVKTLDKSWLLFSQVEGIHILHTVMQTSEIDSLLAVIKIGFFPTQIDPFFRVPLFVGAIQPTVILWCTAQWAQACGLGQELIIFHLEQSGKKCIHQQRLITLYMKSILVQNHYQYFICYIKLHGKLIRISKQSYVVVIVGHHSSSSSTSPLRIATAHEQTLPGV